MTVIVRGDRGAFGGVLTPPQAGPLRLGTLAARAASSAILSVDANGDVVAGALVAADLPSVFTRRDVAETIAADWTWASGAEIVFAPGTLAAPAPASRSVGTRLVLEPVAGSTEYAIGREAGALWTSAPLLTAHKWYLGASELLRLDGALTLFNGTGKLTLGISAGGDGTVQADSHLFLTAGATGELNIGTGSSLVAPRTSYTENLGAINRKWLTLHCAELWAQTLIAADTMATIGGRVLIGPTTMLAADLLASGAGAGPTYQQGMTVKHNNLRVGDWVWMEAAGAFEILQVVSGPVGAAPAWGYLVNRNRDGSGLTDWYAGDAVFNTGTTGDGFIDLYSVRGVNPGTSAGPTIVGNVRTAATATGWREAWAIGNLKGVYGNGSAIYGVAFGAPNGGLHVQIDATNGIRFLDSAQAAYSSWDMSGQIRIGYPTAPNITIGPSGNIELRNGANPTIALEAATGNLSLTGNLRSGATAFGTGTGYWLGWNSGTPQMRVGHPSGNRLEWDGTNLKVVSGNVTIEPGQGITVLSTPGSSFPPSPSYGYNLTARAYGGTCAMWGWESALTRKLELSNETGGASNAAAAIRLWVLGHGGSGTMSGSVDLESYADQLSLFKVLCGDIQIGSTGFGMRLSFKGGATESFVFDKGSSAGHIVPASFPQDIGEAARQWRYQWVYGGIGIAIGGVTPGYLIHLGADSAGKPGSSTWTVTSDARAKRDVQPIDGADALARVRAVEIVAFTYTGAFDQPEGYAGIGVIAQQAAAFLPRSVRERPDGVWDWNAHELLMLNVAAVQQLAARLDTLEGKADR